MSNPPVPPAPSAPSIVSPGTVLGGFRLIARIGVGGMGEVWQAENVRVARMARAVKVIRPELASSPEFRERFLREAEYLELLQHPHIMRVENLGEEAGALFLVMELLAGETLDRLLARKGPLDVPVALAVVAQALEALAHAHRHGIVHRDLKPANMFLTTQGVVKILDFGIARGEDAEKLTATASGIPGSPAYYAPEFGEGHPASAASDLYSLGISLFELIAGRRPFLAGGGTTGQAALSLMLQHATKPLPDIRSLRADAPAELQAVLEKACAKSPVARYASAEEFLAAVRGLNPAPSLAGVAVASLPADLPPPPTPSNRGAPAAVDTRFPVSRAGEATPPTPLPTSGAHTHFAVPRPADERPSIASTPAFVPAAPEVPAAPPTRPVRKGPVIAVILVLLAAAAGGWWSLRTKAQAKAADDEACRAAAAADDQATWNAYLSQFPEGACRSQAQTRVQLLAQDAHACEEAAQAGTREAWEAYLKERPDGSCRARATAKLELAKLDPDARLLAAVQGLAGGTADAADVAGAVRELGLGGESAPALQRVTTVGPEMGEKALAQTLTQLGPGSAVLFRAGRYVLDGTLELAKKHDVALVAEPGTEIFVTTGRAVLVVEESQRVLLHGLYLNHHAVFADKWHTAYDLCLGTLFVPDVKKSNVLELNRSSGVTVVSSELEGSGFIALLARGAHEVAVMRSKLHNCISEGIRLESSDLSGEDVLIFDVGRRQYLAENVDAGATYYCKQELVQANCSATGRCEAAKACSDADYHRLRDDLETDLNDKPIDPPAFRTAITVDAGSSLSLERLTLYVPTPLAKSQAFEIAGKVNVKSAVIAHSSAGIVTAKKANPALATETVCVSAKRVADNFEPGTTDRANQRIQFVPVTSASDEFDARLAPTSDCQGLGARLADPVIHKHIKPGEPFPAAPVAAAVPTTTTTDKGPATTATPSTVAPAGATTATAAPACKDATTCLSQCEGGTALSCRLLASMYENGVGVKEDGTKATAFYKRACDAGDPPGCERYQKRHAAAVKSACEDACGEAVGNCGTACVKKHKDFIDEASKTDSDWMSKGDKLFKDCMADCDRDETRCNQRCGK